LNSIFSEEFKGEQWYKDLFDNAHDLIHIADPEGMLIYANKAWEKVLEYSIAEIQTKSIYTFLDAPDKTLFENYRMAVLQGKEPSKEVTFSLITKSGKKITVEGFLSRKSSNGQALYTRAILRDITTKIENEARLTAFNQQLQEREFNLQQLLQFAPDAIIAMNGEGYITFWNPKAEKIFGWSSAEVIGKCLSDIIIPKQYREAHNNGMKRYLATGQAQVLGKTIEVTGLNKKNEELYISLTISSAIQNGQTTFIAFLRDISEQKKNDLELDKKRQELEQTNQHLEQFAHVASHDMKEPIRKIIFYSQMLQDDSDNTLSGSSADSLAKIQKSADRLYQMVEGVLNYSEVKNFNPSFDDISLSSILATIESDLELLIREKKAVLVYPEFPMFHGAPFLVFQLFYNLINNSLKFTRPGIDPVITITYRIIEEAGKSWIEISVADNGIGFDQKFADQIFNTFTRLHSKNQYEGTGLGLSLCKNIAEKHGGSIRAESNGQGAKFIITLPFLVNESNNRY
jgi:two-component system, LuxR family, sensor kinase FixL